MDYVEKAGIVIQEYDNTEICTRCSDGSIFTAPMKIEEGVKPLYFTYKGEGFVDFMPFTIK